MDKHESCLLELIFDPFRHFVNDLGYFHLDSLWIYIFLFNFIFFLPLGHVHLWSDEQARLCPKDAESCRSRIDFWHFLPGCSALFVQDFPCYLDAYQPVYGYCCTAFNQGHTDIFVIFGDYSSETHEEKKSSKQNKQKR